MGSGYSGCFDYVMSKDNVKKVCPDEMQMIEDLLDRVKLNWDDLARAYQYDDSIHPLYDEFEDSVAEHYEQEIFDTLHEVFKKFHDSCGLSIELQYHDSEHGDRYDDVDGAYFSVSGAYQLTPEAQKLADKGITVSVATWVSYG